MIDVHIVRVEDDGAVVLDPRPDGPGRYRLRELGPLRSAGAVVTEHRGVSVVTTDDRDAAGATTALTTPARAVRARSRASQEGADGTGRAVGTRVAAPAVRPAPRGPRLSPAQVQARLRAGAEPDDVARDAGVDIEWVARWASPVEAEKQEMIRSALTATVTDDDGGATTETLGALVRAWLPRELDREDLDWLVARRRDGRWRLTLRVPDPRGTLTATWIWAPRVRSLVAASARARTISWPDS